MEVQELVGHVERFQVVGPFLRQSSVHRLHGTDVLVGRVLGVLETSGMRAFLVVLLLDLQNALGFGVRLRGKTLDLLAEKNARAHARQLQQNGGTLLQRKDAGLGSSGDLPLREKRLFFATSVLNCPFESFFFLKLNRLQRRLLHTLLLLQYFSLNVLL